MEQAGGRGPTVEVDVSDAEQVEAAIGGSSDRLSVRVTMVQLPALNTPQFDVVKSRLPRRARPVPPVYQPEVAARAIVWAAEHPKRREYWVGGTTAATIVANTVAPGILDRYLGRTVQLAADGRAGGSRPALQPVGARSRRPGRTAGSINSRIREARSSGSARAGGGWRRPARWPPFWR